MVTVRTHDGSTEGLCCKHGARSENGTFKLRAVQENIWQSYGVRPHKETAKTAKTTRVEETTKRAKASIQAAAKHCTTKSK